MLPLVRETVAAQFNIQKVIKFIWLELSLLEMLAAAVHLEFILVIQVLILDNNLELMDLPLEPILVHLVLILDNLALMDLLLEPILVHLELILVNQVLILDNNLELMDLLLEPTLVHLVHMVLILDNQVPTL